MTRRAGPALGIERAVIAQTLVDKGGNIAAAARTLRVPTGDLRRVVAATPLLAASIFDKIEQDIDAAVQILMDGLASHNAMTRIRAAAYILRHSEAARRRGWGTPPASASARSARAVALSSLLHR